MTTSPGFDMNSHLVQAIQDSDDAIMTKALDGTVLTWNPAATRLFGYSFDEMVGQKMIKIFPPERLSEEDLILSELAAGRKVDHFRTQRRHRDGHLIDISVTISPVRDVDGKIVAASKIARDITAELRAEQEIAKYKALIDSSDDGIISKDREGLIRTWNQSATRIFGHTAEQAIGQHVSLLFPPERLHEEEKLLQAVLRGEAVKHFRTTRLRRDGQRIFVSVSLSAIRGAQGEVLGFSKIVRDLTQDVAEEQRLWQDINFDGLTGLMSRNGIQATLDDLIRVPMLRQRAMALVYLQLDGFDQQFGRNAPREADELLVQVAQALNKTVREADEVARLHADRFVVLMNGFADTNSIDIAVGKLRAAVQEIRHVNGAPVSLTALVGVAIYPQHGRSFNSLVKHAEQDAQSLDVAAALAPAKTSGRDAGDLPEDFYLVQALNRALSLDQLHLQYQPIMDAGTGRATKVEALVRWRHPELGQIAPSVFIPLAEKYGLIRPISKWVLRRALQDLARWTGRFGMQFQVSVNRSSHDLVEVEESVDEVRNALHEFGLCGSNLILEITEYSLISSAQTAERILRAYHSMGIGIAMDDFGTGYSSLGYIKRYPVDYLKIDKSFIDKVATHTTDRQLCEGIVDIGRRLGIRTVAEGVETAGQADLLRTMGVEFMQGYYISRPMDAEALEAWLSAADRAAS